jgi:hypothetical protein
VVSIPSGGLWQRRRERRSNHAFMQQRERESGLHHHSRPDYDRDVYVHDQFRSAISGKRRHDVSARNSQRSSRARRGASIMRGTMKHSALLLLFTASCSYSLDPPALTDLRERMRNLEAAQNAQAADVAELRAKQAELDGRVKVMWQHGR